MGRTRVLLFAFSALSLLLIVGGRLFADERSLDQRFRDGAKAYWDGRDDEALEAFQALWTDFGLRNAPLAYNLGVVSLAAKDYGRAVFYFRVARNLSVSAGRLEDIEEGLSQARAGITASAERSVHVQQLVNGSVTGVAYSLTHKLPEQVWAWLTVVAMLALVMIFARWRGRATWWSRGLVACALLTTLLFAGLWATRVRQDETTRLGILLPEETVLREALDPSAPTHSIPAGVEVQILGNDEGAEVLRVRLPTGRKGWVPKKNLGLL